MRAVEFGWAPKGLERDFAIDCMVPWDAPDLICDMLKDGPFMFRYDNGQLCTFRRLSKSPPQGGEG